MRISDKYTKKYIWCLVNRQTKSVLFFYDNGSRGRQVLTDFLGSAEMSAIFHTFIETCKMNQRSLSRSGESNGISTIEYFKKLLSELLTGNNKTRTLFAHSVGFENASLLPQTIGIKR